MATASIITRDLEKMSDQSGNIYLSLRAVSLRARQLNVKLKEELSGKLAEFATTVDNLEEVFENREQIEISRHYERMPKPAAMALEEFEKQEVFFRHREVEEEVTEGEI